MLNKNYTDGFTLIELIVVVVIIAVLATVGINSYSKFSKQASATKVDADMKDIEKAIIIARSISQKTLGEITGSTNSLGASSCSGTDLRNIPDSSSCMAGWIGILSDIKPYEDITHIKRDPWGSPYMIDENDGEFSSNRCRADSLHSAGPNGLLEIINSGGLYAPASGSDDIIIYIAPSYPGC